MLATQFVEFLLVELSALPEFVHLLVNLLGVKRRLLLLGDPVFYALAGALLEGDAECAVAAVTAACLPGGQVPDRPAENKNTENLPRDRSRLLS